MALPFPVVEDGYFDLTPELAKRLLATGSPNRPVKERQVAFLKTQIETGKYRPGARFLGFNESDQLVDGQHLCTAVIEAELPVKSRAARIPQSDVLAVDTGKARSAGDLISLRGIPAGGRIVAMLRGIRSIEAAEGQRKLSLTVGNLLSNEEIWDQVHEDPSLIESAQAAPEIAKLLPFISGRYVAALHHIIRTRAGDDLAQNFWDELADPSPDTLLFRLRRQLITAESAPRKPSQLELTARIAAAWNLWHRNDRDRGVPIPRKFPVIQPTAQQTSASEVEASLLQELDEDK